MLGKIVVHGDKDVPFFDPNLANLVAQVSTQVCITLWPDIIISLFGAYTYNARRPLKTPFLLKRSKIIGGGGG